jgi:hypothetical protein
MVNILTEPTMAIFHRVKFLRDINECKAGDIKEIMIAPMQGRIYKPDRDKNGHYTDTVGVADNRVMTMGLFDYKTKLMDEYYHVFDNLKDLHDSLDEVPVDVEL